MLKANSNATESGTDASNLLALAYLSLGSNVGDRKTQLQKAVAGLAVAGRVVAVSSIYETEPVEFTQQPWFLNCAVALETTLTPEELMAAILRIEKEMGRHRVREKGPRTIDIDILLFGNETRHSPEVTIPHPAMQERRFVLEPLAEIAPKARHPVLKKTVLELCDALPQGQAVRKLQETARPI
ncbi:MAG: 2-amino-4-hydroxy-6-hydroxymethyldihydropteridine diphosphokinase [Candidatus Sulfotelmatobacter sp.]